MHGYFVSFLGPSNSSHLLRGIFICLQNPLLDQILWLWSMFHLFLETVGAHVLLKLLLLSLNGWGGIGVRENVS